MFPVGLRMTYPMSFPPPVWPFMPLMLVAKFVATIVLDEVLVGVAVENSRVYAVPSSRFWIRREPSAEALKIVPVSVKNAFRILFGIDLILSIALSGYGHFNNIFPIHECIMSF